MKIDVIVITYGEPPTPSFLEQWNYSNQILRRLTRLVAPIPKCIIPLFGAYRGYTRTKNWLNENFGSPLEEITRRQAESLHTELRNALPDRDWRIHIAYEFRDPMLEVVLTNIQRTGTDEIILAPMYVPISDFTNKISERDYERFQARTNHSLPDPKTVTFRQCHNDLANVMADFIRRKIRELGLTDEERSRHALLLGCHGTVMTPPKGISDAGYCDTKQLYDDLESLLRPEFQSVAIGWLNHRLGGEWTTPTLEQSVKSLLENGIQQFVYFPFGFLADNAETVLEGRTVLRDLGVTEYHHLPCMNVDPSFIRFLAQQVVEAHRQAAQPKLSSVAA